MIFVFKDLHVNNIDDKTKSFTDNKGHIFSKKWKYWTKSNTKKVDVYQRLQKKCQFINQ